MIGTGKKGMKVDGGERGKRGVREGQNGEMEKRRHGRKSRGEGMEVRRRKREENLEEKVGRRGRGWLTGWRVDGRGVSLPYQGHAPNNSIFVHVDRNKGIRGQN